MNDGFFGMGEFADETDQADEIAAEIEADEGGLMADVIRRIRICRTHDREADSIHTFETNRGIGNTTHDIVEMVWSSDGSALLAITECELCHGSGQGQCPTCDCCYACGGRGYEYQAETARRAHRTLFSGPSYSGGEEVAVVRL